MAKRARDEGPRVTLFPFLSILACVIGTLILMISSLALSQMHTPPGDEDIMRGQEFLELEKERSDLLARRDTLLRDIEDQGDLAAKLRRVRNELARLRDLERKRAVADRRFVDQERLLQAEHSRLEKLLKAMVAEHADLDKRIAPLQAELARRKDVPSEAVLQVAPGGSGRADDLKPAFVEAAATGLILHEDGTRVAVPRASVDSHVKYLELLGRVARDPSRIVIFLIREDGVSSYMAGRHVAASRGARHGMLPLVGQGNLDLSLFNAR